MKLYYMQHTIKTVHSITLKTIVYQQHLSVLIPSSFWWIQSRYIFSSDNKYIYKFKSCRHKKGLCCC